MATADPLVLVAAMRSAYVVLARRLALDHELDLMGLAADLDMLGSTQPEADWQEGHQTLADVLRGVALRVPANDG